MGHPPILSNHLPRLTAEDRRRAATLAQRLRREQPRLAPRDEFAELRTWRLDDGPTLHLDDLSAITLPGMHGSLDYLEDRARLRAGEGDLIATRIRPSEGYETYCRERLGLGAVRWIRVRPPGPRRHLAASCWVDRRSRAEMRRAEYRYIHPHMGSFAVWALADLLRRSTHRQLQVIAPPPSLTRAVNDKLWFADVVARLLGEEMLPRTHAVSNHLAMAYVVREVAAESRQLVVKLTDSVGGGGNLVLDSDRFRTLPLGKIRRQLQSLLAPLEWRCETRILVGSWETEVLSAPSSQLWIPPLEVGEPIVEGLFEQLIAGREGLFVGTRPASLPESVTVRIVDSTWLLGRLFQHLGYVGRCSFDLLLIGRSPDDCKIELVECNGRWGGTSLPMTLLTRLLGNWTGHRFACLDCPVAVDRGEPSGSRSSSHPPIDFATLEGTLEPLLFDIHLGSGELILYNPAGLRRGRIAVAGLGQRYFRDPHDLTRRLEGALTGDASTLPIEHQATAGSGSLV